MVAEAEIASRVVTDGPKPPPPPDPPPDPPPPTWPRWRVVVAALVALLVAGGIGWAAVAQPFGADDTAPNPTTT